MGQPPMADMLCEGWVKPGSPTWRFSSLRQTASRLLREIAGTTGAARAPPPSAPSEARGVGAVEHLARRKHNFLEPDSRTGIAYARWRAVKLADRAR
jgi:hypothetical protein